MGVPGGWFLAFGFWLLVLGFGKLIIRYNKFGNRQVGAQVGAWKPVAPAFGRLDLLKRARRD
jgi:hypothetical protein